MCVMLQKAMDKSLCLDDIGGGGGGGISKHNLLTPKPTPAILSLNVIFTHGSSQSDSTKSIP